MKLQTKLTLFMPSKRVQRRHYTLHRCASSFASVDEFDSEMHRLGWVDHRGPVNIRTLPTFKQCSGCGIRNKTKRSFATNQWLREGPRCLSCTKTSEDLESDRRMVHREAAREAALAAFVPPQPRATVQGAVLPLPKEDKPERHFELATEVLAAATSSSPAELAAVPAAAPKRGLPLKAKEEAAASSSQVKRRKKVALDKTQKATKGPMPPLPLQVKRRQQLAPQSRPSPSQERHMQQRALGTGEGKAEGKRRRRFLQQLASAFTRVKPAFWYECFRQQEMMCATLWWLRHHWVTPLDYNWSHKVPPDEIPKKIRLQEEAGLDFWSSVPLSRFANFEKEPAGHIPYYSRLSVDTTKGSWLGVVYEDAAKRKDDHIMWVSVYARGERDTYPPIRFELLPPKKIRLQEEAGLDFWSSVPLSKFMWPEPAGHIPYYSRLLVDRLDGSLGIPGSWLGVVYEDAAKRKDDYVMWVSVYDPYAYLIQFELLPR